MNIVFIIRRHNFFKFLASIIEETLKRGHEVECWHDLTHPTGGMKGYLYPAIEKSPFYNGGHNNLKIKEINEERGFEQLLGEKLVKDDIDFFVGLEQLNAHLKESLKEYLNGKWCIIMHGIDTFGEVQILPLVKHFKYKRYCFVYSEYFFQFGIEWIKKYFPEKSYYFETNYTSVVPIGCTIIGNRNKLSNIDSGEIRRKYGIPANKNIVIYLPFTGNEKIPTNKNQALVEAFTGIIYNKYKSRSIIITNNSWKSYLRFIIRKIYCYIAIFMFKESRLLMIKRYNESRLFREIRKFCAKNNLLLVVKPRLKLPVVDSIKNNADIFIIDEEKNQYPTVLQELLSIADLTIGGYSNAALESVSFGVPYVVIKVSDFMFDHEAHRSIYPNDSGSMFNFKSAVNHWDASTVFSDFRNMSIKDFKIDPKDKEEYLEKFVGPLEETAAIRFCNYMENILCPKTNIDPS